MVCPTYNAWHVFDYRCHILTGPGVYEIFFQHMWYIMYNFGTPSPFTPFQSLWHLTFWKWPKCWPDSKESTVPCVSFSSSSEHGVFKQRRVLDWRPEQLCWPRTQLDQDSHYKSECHRVGQTWNRYLSKTFVSPADVSLASIGLNNGISTRWIIQRDNRVDEISLN